MHDTYFYAGSIYRKTNDYKKAQYYYLEAKKIADKYFPTENSQLDIAEELRELYIKMGEKDSVAYYSQKIIEIQHANESKNISVKNTIDNKDLNEKESLKNNNKNLIYSLIGAAIVCCFLIYIAFFFYRKNKSKKLDKIDIPLVESTPQNNYSELFEEVVLLAKQNKQEFLTRFNDLYPDFTRKILLLNNNIQSSELRFCAYLYLNFSTKDIAEYTFTSVRTVQTKKYNLRKKLNIPTDIDIYVWFSDLLK